MLFGILPCQKTRKCCIKLFLVAQGYRMILLIARLDDSCLCVFQWLLAAEEIRSLSLTISENGQNPPNVSREMMRCVTTARQMNIETLNLNLAQTPTLVPDIQSVDAMKSLTTLRLIFPQNLLIDQILLGISSGCKKLQRLGLTSE